MRRKKAILIHGLGMFYLLILLFTTITSSTEAYFVDKTVTKETIKIGYWDVETEMEDLDKNESEGEENHGDEKNP